jgi:PleD family two-component response regulator
MTDRARTALSADARRGLPSCLLRVRPDDLDSIRTAFGRTHAESAISACGAALRDVAPAGTLVGLEEDRAGFEVLRGSTSSDEGRRWAEDLRRYLRSVPVEVPGSRLRLVVSVGLASTAEHGHDLDALREAAASSLRQAQREGGDRVRAASAG